MKQHSHAGDEAPWSLGGVRPHVRKFHPDLEHLLGTGPDAPLADLEAAHQLAHAGAAAGGQETVPGEAGLYREISLVFSHSWPGQAYLRFEAASGAVTMVAVNAADRAALRVLCREEI